MSLFQLEEEALRLPEKERAVLASRLLSSIHCPLHDDDDGVAEAMLRDVEMENDPSVGMTMGELRSALGR